MYDTEMRLAIAERRAAELIRMQHRLLTTILTILCLIISVSLASVAGASLDIAEGYVPGLYGTTMLSEDAGGYVLTGVLSFSAAVVITVLCIRHREKGNSRK